MKEVAVTLHGKDAAIHYIDVVEGKAYKPNFTLPGDTMQAPRQRVLPDPGIPVFIRVFPGHPHHNRIAVLREARDAFTVALFHRNANPSRVSVDAVQSWDYAVPASDLL